MPPLNKIDVGNAPNSTHRHGFRSTESPEQSLNEQPSRSASSTPKSVRFDYQVRLYFVLHRNDYSQHEAKSSWYSGMEYTSFKREIAMTVRMVSSTNPPRKLDCKDYTSRGVECRTVHKLESRHRAKSEARSAVFEEQDFQRHTGKKNVEWVAAKYRQETKETVQEAICLGAADELDARIIHNEGNEKEEFNDDWIRSVSPTNHKCWDEMQHPTFWEDDNESGFDDSWIRDLSKEASQVTPGQQAVFGSRLLCMTSCGNY